MKITRQMKRLPLEGAHNVRDLGGYPCKDGATRFGVFLRSDYPSAKSSNDINTLMAYGISTCIDLRAEDERAKYPPTLQGVENFENFHVSMTDDMNSTNFEGDLPGSMSGLYISLLDNSRGEVCRVMKIIAAAPRGVLYHCAVGKDRTGVISMLLLKLAGVADGDIVADYSVTDIYMREILEAHIKEITDREVPKYLIRSRPDSMWRTLEHFNATYKNIDEYLLGCGVTAAEIEAIRKRFIEQ